MRHPTPVSLSVFLISNTKEAFYVYEKYGNIPTFYSILNAEKYHNAFHQQKTKTLSHTQVSLLTEYHIQLQCNTFLTRRQDIVRWLHIQALADVRSTGAEIKCLYCIGCLLHACQKIIHALHLTYMQSIYMRTVCCLCPVIMSLSTKYI